MKSHRFLAPSLSLTFLLFGLCFADAAEKEIFLRHPERVEMPSRIQADGGVEVQGYTDFFNACEEFHSHRIQNENDLRIVIHSYISSPLDADCSQEFFPENVKTYRVSGLSQKKTYQVYFRDFHGQLVRVGELTPW